VNFLLNNPTAGAYFRIGAEAQARLRTYRSRNAAMADLLLGQSWVSVEDVARAAAYRTTLTLMTPADFDSVRMRHSSSR
jgi:hypothetical protein